MSDASDLAYNPLPSLIGYSLNMSVTYQYVMNSNPVFLMVNVYSSVISNLTDLTLISHCHYFPTEIKARHKTRHCHCR